MPSLSWDLSQPRILARATLLVFAAHLAFILLIGPLPLAGDAVAYDELGRSLVANGTYVFDGERVVNFMPAYPFFIALGYKLFGFHPFVVRVMQAGLFAGTCALYCRTLATFFNERVARLGFLVLALLPAFFIYPTTLNAETYVLFAGTSVLYALSRLATSDSAGNSALFGLTVALLCLAKPEFSVWILSGTVLLFGAKRGLSSMIRSLAIAGTTMALTILPWTLRNALVFGKFIPLSISSGRALWITAHRPALFDYNGADFKSALQACEVIGDPKTTDDCLKRQAIEMLKDHPGDYLLGCVKRTGAFFFGSHTEYLSGFSENFGATLHEHHYGVFVVKALLLAIHSAIVLVGIVGLAWLARKRAWLFLAYLFLTKTLVHVVIFATPRYSLHLMPLFVLGVAWILSERLPAQRERAV